MHTISAKKEKGFKVEVFGLDGETVYSAWHKDRNEAQTVAELEQRKVLFPPLTLDDISDKELMDILGDFNL